MQIAHIFNEHKANNKTEFINSQEFEKEYIKNYQKCYMEDNYKIYDDFSHKYYEALKPSKSSNIISKYDDEKLEKILKNLTDGILMISGDFWGIQKFIFGGVVAKKASKILRSRSAMVQLITYVVVDILKKEFQNSDVVLFGAGKFLLLAKYEKDYKDKLNSIQKELDSYFLKNYFGENGFILSSTTTTQERLQNQDSQDMKQDLENLAKDNELKKFTKFNFLELEDDEICIDIFQEELNDTTVCKYCSKRVIVKDEACSICLNQIELGEKLTKNRYIKIYKSQQKTKDISLLKFNENYYYVSFFNTTPQDSYNTFDISTKSYCDIPKWSLNSYVAKIDDEIKTFEELANGSSGLFALKADVDKLGDTFREYYMTSFKKFNRLSRELDFFFSDYATDMMQGKNLYTVFAGGDDLFVIGEYKEIVEYAKKLREEFYRFSLQKATLSMGLVMFKPSTPINYISTKADDAEARAKAIVKNKKDRDGIDIFGISMKFGEFLNIEKEFKKVVEFLEKNGVDTTTFYYRLIEFCDMRTNINENIQNALWKSKLNYLIRRNIAKENNDFNIFEILYNLIEDNGERLKPSIFLKIYENRDKTKKGEK